MQGSLDLLEKLRGLPALKHLSLEKRYDLGMSEDLQELPPDELQIKLQPEDKSGFMELVLFQLRKLSGLQTLQFAAVNNDVSLHR